MTTPKTKDPSIIGEETASKVRKSFETLQRVCNDTTKSIELITQDYELGEKLKENLLQDEKRLKEEIERIKEVVYCLAIRNIIHRGNKNFFYGMIRYEAHFGILLPFMNDISVLKYSFAKGNEKLESLVRETRKSIYQYAIQVMQNTASKLEKATRKDFNGKLLLSNKEAEDLFK